MFVNCPVCKSEIEKANVCASCGYSFTTKKAGLAIKKTKGKKAKQKPFVTPSVMKNAKRAIDKNKIKAEGEALKLHKFNESDYTLNDPDKDWYEEYTEESVDDDSVNPLWVYEPDDFADLSIDEVRTIWANRQTLCGSIEAAAEAQALLYVADGVDEYYQGWQSYVHSSEVNQLALDQNLESCFKELFVEEGKSLRDIHYELGLDNTRSITRDDLQQYTLDELQVLWQEKEERIDHISVACELFSLIRHLQGYDKVKTPWFELLDHEQIEPLFDVLLDDSEQIEPEAGLSSERLNEAAQKVLAEDRRVEVTQKRKQRYGQSDFRTYILKAYGYKCCVTGVNDRAVIEAAHIIPYMGEHSNILDNGLALRVDIHRLFDKYLLSIDPETLTVEISSSVCSDEYKSLSGKRIKLRTTDLLLANLVTHYRTFNLKNNNCLV